ncbi:DUF4097 family beta strand repeat-containing protein [Ilumatobacter sp.]|uniref:DUF4097 family beta strand repeat-containing protein n=1 Tax=Ilumatobacter sp. TaxID=1967498 RepID=UPI003B516AC9
MTDSVIAPDRTSTDPTSAEEGGPTPAVARRAWLPIASVLTLLALGWGTWNVVAVLAHGERTDIVDYTEIRAVSIDNDDGWVTVRSDDGADAVTVTTTISEGLRAPDVSAEVVDGQLVLESSCPSLMSTWCSVTYTIDVPTHTDVTVRSDNGRIELRGVLGAVDIGGDNGSIEADALEATSLRLETDNGSIRASGALAPVVTAETENGSTRLFFDRPPGAVDAESKNGSVEVVVPATGEAYDVDASSDNGGETVSVPVDSRSDRRIDAHTRNGSVSVRTERG